MRRNQHAAACLCHPKAAPNRHAPIQHLLPCIMVCAAELLRAAESIHLAYMM